jgi:uracil phosphoribosyltransferase
MLDTFISILRNKETKITEFRSVSDIVAILLAGKTLEHIETEEIPITTPFVTTRGKKISHNIVLVPILRAGISMLPAFLKIFPEAKVGIIGLKRDELSPTKEAKLYYKNFPHVSPKTFAIILDPTIATGGTTAQTIQNLQKDGIPDQNILCATIFAAQPGIDMLKKKFPNVTILTAVIDPELSDQKFILPGFGDFGDRYFGTL